MLRLEALTHLYRQRLRTHLGQELLAGAGIAVGVALVFAVIVANTSISTSARQIAQGISGNATLQLNARDELGFTETLLPVVRSLPGVAHAAGIIEQRAILSGTRHDGSVVLVGADASLATLGGSITQDVGQDQGLVLRNGLLVPSGLAAAIGIARARSGQPRTVVLKLRGQARRVHVAAVVGNDTIGALSGALVAVAPLRDVQRLASLPDRLTRILVEPQPGHQQEVRRRLLGIAAGRITVSPADRESRILAQASAPNDQSTELFAAISAIVGVLLAFNAMLLTVPERRRAIAELRTHGYSAGQIVQMITFEALLLGILASGVGLAAGLLLAHVAFGGVPTYLAFAFPFGAQQTVPTSTILVCFLGGVLATFAAAAQPLFDLVSRRSPDAVYREEGEPGQALGARVRRAIGLAAVALLLATTVLVALVPSTTVWGIGLLALSTLFALPAVLGLVVAGADRLAAPFGRLNMLAVAVMALRSTRLRAVALAATGAVAVFGSVSIEGAHRDLVRGLHRNFVEYLGTTDLWVTTGGNDLTTENFLPADARARISRTPGVAAVRPYYGGLLDIGERRGWVIARSSADHQMLPAGELEAGDAAQATAALRRGGAVAASKQIVDMLHAHVGGMLALPTPTGIRRYRLVATMTNLGWGPGAIILNADDYTSAWANSYPTAFEVDLRRGVDPVTARRAVQRAIGPQLSLHAQTAADRIDQYDSLANAGLHRLTQISTLLLAAAAVALIAATGAAIGQRKKSFVDYRFQGYTPGQLWTALLIESGLVLSIGCGTGATAGLYGHLLLGRWLRLTTGFPAPFSVSVGAAAATFALVAITALVVTALPSYRAVQAPSGAEPSI